MTPQNRHKIFPFIIRVISCLLIITFISQTIVWAYPDNLTKIDSQNTKLAPQSFFTENESIERAYGKAVEYYIEGNGIPRNRLTLSAVKAALRIHKDETWFKDNIGYTESDHEVRISFNSGYIIRYYDPTAISAGEQKKYESQMQGEAGRPSRIQLNPYLHKQLLRIKSLPASKPGAGSTVAPKKAEPIMPEAATAEDFVTVSAAKFSAAANKVLAAAVTVLIIYQVISGSAEPVTLLIEIAIASAVSTVLLSIARITKLMDAARAKPAAANMETGKAESAAKLEDPLVKVIINNLKSKILLLLADCDLIISRLSLRRDDLRDPSAIADSLFIKRCGILLETMRTVTTNYSEGRYDVEKMLMFLDGSLVRMTYMTNFLQSRLDAGGYRWDPGLYDMVESLARHSATTTMPLIKAAVTWMDRTMIATDVEGVLKEAASNAMKSKDVDKNVIVEIGVSDEVKDAKDLLTYRLLLSMAVEELLRNAAQYSQTRRIAITASFFEAGELKINVRDYGTGIPGDRIDKIFLKSVPEAPDNKDRTKYGLPDLREAIESVGGYIWAHKTYRKGALFTFTLPVVATMDAAHRPPSLSAPVVVAVSGLAGSGRGTIAQWLAAKLGLCYINRGDLARATVFEMLEEAQRGNEIDVKDEAATTKFVETLFRSGRFRYSGPTLMIGEKDVSKPEEPKGLAFRDRIRVEIDKDIANTDMLHKVFSYEGVKRALDAFVESQAQVISTSGKYNGIVMKVTDPILSRRGVINIMLTAPAEIRAQRAKMKVSRIEKLDVDTGKVKYPSANPDVHMIRTATISHRIAEDALLYVVSKLPASDKDKLKSYLNWPGIKKKRDIKLEIASFKDQLANRGYEDIPHETIVLEHSGKKRAFTILGSFGKESVGGHHLNIAFEEATNELYVIKKLITKEMEIHCQDVPKVMALTEGHEGIYKAKLMYAGTGKWAGLEEAEAIVYPYVRGHDFTDYKLQYKDRPLAEYSRDLLDIVIEVSNTCEFLEEKKVDGIWDIKSENIIITDEKKPVLIDYTLKKVPTIEAIEYLLYDSFEDVNIEGIKIDGVLPTLQFVADPDLNKEIVAQLMAIHKNVKAQKYKHIKEFNDDLKAVRKLFDTGATRAVLDMVRPGESNVAVSLDAPEAPGAYTTVQSARTYDENIEEKLATLVAIAENMDKPYELDKDSLAETEISWDEAEYLAAFANLEWERIGSSRRFVINDDTRTLQVLFTVTGSEIFSKKEKKLWSGERDFGEAGINSSIRKEYIEKGKAVEIRDDGTVVRIRRNRSNPRSPPLEARFRSEGILDNIRKAKDPAMLRSALQSGANFRNLDPEEQEKLLQTAKNITLSVLLGQAVLLEEKKRDEITNKDKTNYVVSHIRQGFGRKYHGLEPTVWIGELLLARMTPEQTARLLLEESQHIVRPFTYMGMDSKGNAKWSGLHDYEVSQDADPKTYIIHDKKFVNSLPIENAVRAQAELSAGLKRPMTVLSIPPVKINIIRYIMRKFKADIKKMISSRMAFAKERKTFETDLGRRPGRSNMVHNTPGLPAETAAVIEAEMKADDLTPQVRRIEQQCLYQGASGMGTLTDKFGVFFATPTPMALTIIHYLKRVTGPGAKICDLGSGNGAFCFFASRHFSDVTGIEGVKGLYEAGLKNQEILSSPSEDSGMPKELRAAIPETSKVSFVNGDFLDDSTDLSKYDALYFFYTKPRPFKTEDEFAAALRAKLLSRNGMKPGAKLIILGSVASISDDPELLYEPALIGPLSFSVYTRAMEKPGSSNMTQRNTAADNAARSGHLRAESLYKDCFETLFEFNLKLFVLMARRMKAKRLSDQAAVVSAKIDTLKCLTDLLKEMDGFEARLKILPQDIRMAESYQKARQEFSKVIDMIAKDNEPAANAALVAALNVVSKAREDILSSRMSSSWVRINVDKKDGKLVMRQQAYIKADDNAKTLVPAYIEKTFDMRWQAGRSLDDQEDSILDERQKISEYLNRITQAQTVIDAGGMFTADDASYVLSGLTGVLVEEKRLARIALTAAKELIDTGETGSVKHLLPIAKRYLELRVEDIDRILHYLKVGRIEPFREIVMQDNAVLIAKAKRVEKLLIEGSYRSARGNAYDLMKAAEPYLSEPDLEGFKTVLGPVIGDALKLMRGMSMDKSRALFWTGLARKKLEDSQRLAEFMEAFRTEYARRRISASSPYLKEDTFVDVFESFIKDKQLIRTSSQTKSFQILCYLASFISMENPAFVPINTLRLLVEIDDIGTILRTTRLQRLSETIATLESMTKKAAISDLTKAERTELVKAIVKDFGLDEPGRLELAKAFAINKQNLRRALPVQQERPASSNIVAEQQPGHIVDVEDVAVAGRVLPVIVKEEMRADLLAPQQVIMPQADEKANIDRIGEQTLGEGSVGLISVAGGMSSRAGINYPKGMHPITPLSEKSFFRARAEELLAARNKYGKPVMWFIMTSDVTDTQTREYFTRNGYFSLGKESVIFFRQNSVPALVSGTQDAAMKDGTDVLTAPNGHGGLYEAMREALLRTDGAHESALAEAKRRGIETFLFANIDNPMPVLDKFVLGNHIKSDSDFTTVLVRKRDANEGLAMMAIDTVTGKPFLVEYNQPAAEAIKTLPGFEFGSINRLVFSRRFLESVTPPPYHRIARKKTPIFKDGKEQDALIDKFESFVFEVQDQAKKTINVYSDRAICFAAFKALEGPDSPQAVAKAMSDLTKRWIRESGRNVTISDESTLEISPAFATSVAEAAKKIGNGFEVKGNASVYFGGSGIKIGKNVLIDGAKVYVEFEDPYDGSFEIPDNMIVSPGADVKVFVKKGEKVAYDAHAKAITLEEIRAVLDEISKKDESGFFNAVDRNKIEQKILDMGLRRGATALVVGPGNTDYLPMVLLKLGIKTAMIDMHKGAIASQKLVHRKYGMEKAVESFTSYDDIKGRAFDYIFMLAVLHTELMPSGDNIAMTFWMTRKHSTDKDQTRNIETMAEDYFVTKIGETMAPIMKMLNPDGGYLFVNDLTPYSVEDCLKDPINIWFYQRQLQYLDKVLAGISKRSDTILSKQPINIDNFSMSPGNEKETRRSVVYKLERKVPPAKPLASEDAQKLAALHILSQAGIDGKEVKDGARILLSENLFIKDGDDQDLVAIRAALGSLLQEGGPVAIMKPEEIRRAALNKDVTKEKMAAVFTKEDFENKAIWNGSDKEASLRSSVLIFDDKMTGNNYLYLEGVIGLARAVMAHNRQAIKEYYRLISGVAIDDQILQLLKDDDQNNVAFAIKAILKFKPISMIVDSEEFNKTRISMENALISA